MMYIFSLGVFEMDGRVKVIVGVKGPVVVGGKPIFSFGWEEW